MSAAYVPAALIARRPDWLLESPLSWPAGGVDHPWIGERRDLGHARRALELQRAHAHDRRHRHLAAAAMDLYSAHSAHCATARSQKVKHAPGGDSACANNSVDVLASIGRE